MAAGIGDFFAPAHGSFVVFFRGILYWFGFQEPRGKGECCDKSSQGGKAPAFVSRLQPVFGGVATLATNHMQGIGVTRLT